MRAAFRKGRPNPKPPKALTFTVGLPDEWLTPPGDRRRFKPRKPGFSAVKAGLGAGFQHGRGPPAGRPGRRPAPPPGRPRARHGRPASARGWRDRAAIRGEKARSRRLSVTAGRARAARPAAVSRRGRQILVQRQMHGGRGAGVHFQQMHLAAARRGYNPARTGPERLKRARRLLRPLPPSAGSAVAAITLAGLVGVVDKQHIEMMRRHHLALPAGDGAGGGRAGDKALGADARRQPGTARG